MDSQILALYAKGMSTRDIVDIFKKMYGADISAILVSKVIESVLEKVIQWCSRLLDQAYPIVLDIMRLRSLRGLLDVYFLSRCHELNC